MLPLEQSDRINVSFPRGVPTHGLAETEWRDEIHRVILIGSATNPKKRNAVAKNSMDLSASNILEAAG